MNSRKTVLFIFLLSLAYTVTSQQEVKIKKNEFKLTDKVEGLKEAWKSVKQGNKYYAQGKGTHDLARDHYLFANQYNGYNSELNYLIGICYLSSDTKNKSLDYFLRAFELEPYVATDIKLLIARAYHYSLEFDRAKEFYMDYKNGLPLGEDIVVESNLIDKYIIECTHGKTLTQTPKRVIIQNLGNMVNSIYDDYNPRFAFQDTALYFTSRRPVEDKKSKRSEFDNKFFEDIYISKVSDGEFNKARTMGKPFTAKGNQAIVGVSPDGDALLVYIGAKDGGEIQKVDYRADKGKWMKPKSLSKNIGSDAEETTAALLPGGKELYFVSANPDLSVGGKDLFVSKMNAKGKWGEPRSLGGLLNSKYDEEGVYLTNDMQTLYFASKGHNSMGGFDIFKSERKENGSWGVPQNLGYPINTPDDEVFYVTDKSGIYGYYSALRDGGKGGKDIYKVVALGSEKEVLTLPFDRLIAGIEYLDKNPFISLPAKVKVDTTLLLSGMVRDTIGGADTTIMAGLSFMDPETGEIVARAMAGKDGTYKARIPAAKIYGIEINATGYLYYLDIIDLSKLNPDEPASQDFYLQRIEVGTKVVLDNIYFETGKTVLSAVSYESLDQVVRFLDNNKSVRLEISGHTDNTGSLRINTNLSQARAKAVVDYLVSKGIESGRLEYKGYADSQPVAGNDTPEGREQNRRVEFKVLSK